MQVADLIVFPIGRHILEKNPRKIGESFRRNLGVTMKENIWDLVWLFYLEKEKRRPNDSVTILLAQDFI